MRNKLTRLDNVVIVTNVDNKNNRQDQMILLLRQMWIIKKNERFQITYSNQENDVKNCNIRDVGMTRLTTGELT